MLRSVIAVVAILVSANALAEDIVWRTDRVVGKGAGCQFSGAGQNAWAIAAGNDLALVYSRLGQDFRTRRAGVQVSACDVFIPAELSPGFYVSAVDQKFLFGISKKVGADVEIVGVSNFARRQPNGMSNPADLRKTMAQARLSFGAAEEVVRALQEVAMPLVRVRPDGDVNAPFERLCARRRPRELNFHSQMKIRVIKNDPTVEVSVAIDGQDLRLNLANAVSPCPSSDFSHR